MKQLETKHLILRAFQETDLNDFFEYASVSGVGEAAGWPHHTDINITKDILNDFISKDEVYALVFKENNKVIGSLGIHSREKEGFSGQVQKEIGYVLSKDYWSQGLMTEAVKKVIGYCFTNLNVDILWCGHFNKNDKSRRVIEKTGFKYYGDYIYNAKLLNEEYPSKSYILKKEEYLENNLTNAIDLLGKKLNVEIDRPLNSFHPSHNIIYELNYGYIPDTLSLDGDEIDAYILGVDVPVLSYYGECIAVIKRKNDVEDKLVIAPIGLRFSKRQIKKATKFIEKYFKSKIIIKSR